ncbi:MAG TPA: hypothetical protein VG142_16245 [Trebonia sp.]|nr:hypothetical protein [Trebonia sp.]
MEGRSPPGPLTAPAPEGADLLLSSLGFAAGVAFPERMGALALRARELDSAGALPGILLSLMGRGPDERRVALHMAMAARDLGFIASVLAGPDLDLRRAALRAVRLLPVPDDAVPPALADAPLALRKAVYRTLLHGRRAALASAMLPGVRRQWGDREAALLLPACDQAAVTRWLPELGYAVTAWGRFARHHPGAVLDAVERDLADGIFFGRVWRRYRSALARIAVRDPSAVHAVLQRQDGLAGMSANFPAAAQAALPDLRQWSDADIAASFAHHYPLKEVFAALPPARRGAVFAALVSRHPWLSRGIHVLQLLDVLPFCVAAAEARRMLDWLKSEWHSSREHADNPEVPLRLTAYLPYAEAADTLRDAALTGDARRRGLARSLLLGCAARTGDPSLVVSVLAEVAERTANEPDPVREAAVSALGSVRPVLLTPACVPALERLASATAALDCSAGTREALTRLACRALRHSASDAVVSWGIGVIVALVERFGADGLAGPGCAEPPAGTVRRGRRQRRRARMAPLDSSVLSSVSKGWLERGLRRGQEHALLDALGPALAAARERRDHKLLVALAGALGRRAATLPELQDDLFRAAADPDYQGAWLASMLWLKYAPDRDARTARLLRAAPEQVRCRRVWQLVAGRQTDLLLGALRECPPDAGWTPVVLASQAGRWTPAQRDQIRDLLSAQVGDPGIPAARRAQAVVSVSRIPGSADRVLSWAASEEATVAEAALGCLGHAGRSGDVLRVLLSRRGDTSRAATAALMACAERVQPSLLEALLGEALLGGGVKVTIRKQAARLLGWHRTSGAVGLLLRAWADPGLHRDTRIAVATAIRTLFDDPRALPALREAAGAHASEPMLRALFQAQPQDCRPADRPAYASLVQSLLLAADGPGVRFRGSRAFGTWARWYKGDLGSLLESAADPRNPAGQESVQILVALLRDGLGTAEVITVVERLTALPGDPGLSGTVAMRRLGAITRAVSQTPGRFPREDWPASLCAQVVALLRGSSRFLGYATDIAIALACRHADSPAGTACPVSDADRAGRIAAGLGEVAALIGDRPVLAAAAAKDVVRALLGNGYRSRPQVGAAVLLDICARLVSGPDLASGFFACGLVSRGGSQASWPQEWTGLLETLRRSPHEEVSRIAWETP